MEIKEELIQAIIEIEDEEFIRYILEFVTATQDLSGK